MYKIKNVTKNTINIITERGSYLLEVNESLDLDGICSRGWIYSNPILKKLIKDRKVSVVYDSVKALSIHGISQKPTKPTPIPGPVPAPILPVPADYAKFTVLVKKEKGFVPGVFVYLFQDLHYANVAEEVYSAKLVSVLDKKSFPAFGIITRIEHSTLCRVQFEGQTPAIFKGLIQGSNYFIGNNGLVSLTPPKIAGKAVHVQRIGRAISTKSMYINMSDTIMVVK